MKQGSSIRGNQEDPMLDAVDMPMLSAGTPSFKSLFDSGQIAPGNPLCFGYSKEGTPQYRDIEDIIAMLLSSWQGGGKTTALAYIANCVIAQDPNAHVYCIDPHKGHPESFGGITSPLHMTGRYHMISNTQAGLLMDKLNILLDLRLKGSLPSDPLVVLIIDEINALGKTDVFKYSILPFLSRCTEEIRKANIMMLAAGHKWQARFFNNDATLRQLCPSRLVLPTKSGQAKFLFEDQTMSECKKLMKQVNSPGEALLATSHDADPSVVTLPLITVPDIMAVGTRYAIANGGEVDYIGINGTPKYRSSQFSLHTINNDVTSDTPDVTEATIEEDASDTDVVTSVSLDNIPATLDIEGVTPATQEIVTLQREVVAYMKKHSCNAADVAKKAGNLNRGLVSRLMNQNEASPDTFRRLKKVVSGNGEVLQFPSKRKE
jgi:hypothetical protein